MQIKYISVELKNELENLKIIKRKYGKDINQALKKFKDRIRVSTDIGHLIRTNRGMRIEKVKTSSDEWKARLNKK